MAKKSYKAYLYASIFFTVTFLGILVFWILHCVNVSNFNSTVHTQSGVFTDSYDNVEKNDDVVLSVYPRGGSSDTWVKEYNSEDYSYHDLCGQIYEMRVDNLSEYKVSDWRIIQKIKQSCYVNNAWCGTLEIHQFDSDGNENVQTVDFKDLHPSDLTLEHFMIGNDLMIPLNAGDVLYYYPSEDVFETPIHPYGTYDASQISTGIIYYYWDNGMDLSDISMEYNYNRSTTQGSAYVVFVSLLALWAMCLIIAVILIASNARIRRQQVFIDEALTVFTHFIDAKDPYTNGHSSRVAEYSQKIAHAMGMSDRECRNVYYIALLHDVGKCYISDDILKKPGKLTDEEFENIKSHTVRGANMLKDLKSLPDIYNGALYHHERYDGKGYPTGKAGSDIPLIGRIICVADSFDAMNSNRCYRPRLTPEVITSEIRKNSGTQFDPEIAEIFLKLIENNEISFD